MRRAGVLLMAALLPALAAPPVVIRNANVITITKGNFKGSVLLRDGKIEAFGEKIVIPSGAEIIDAAG
ncbi:MAG TPA: hypothetical protein PLP04_14580, partial [Bryobacteraceae bacterium]|nr:hypothetical protein [Bryobacteraceae bacterium]